MVLSFVTLRALKISLPHMDIKVSFRIHQGAVEVAVFDAEAAAPVKMAGSAVLPGQHLSHGVERPHEPPRRRDQEHRLRRRRQGRAHPAGHHRRRDLELTFGSHNLKVGELP